MSKSIFEKYNLDVPSFLDCAKHLLAMAGFDENEKIAVIVQKKQITIIGKEKG